MLHLGMVLQERYEVVRPVGKGGQGRVYLAHHLGLGERPVALKEMALPLGEAHVVESALNEFHCEAAMLGALDHPGLVPVHDAFLEAEHAYLVMDFIDGPTLEVVLRQTPGFLPVSQVMAWLDELADVLQYLHQRTPPIIFRDLKLSNVLVDGGTRLRLVDFGIARFFNPHGQTATYVAGMGSPGFAPVEQYSGGTDVRSDIYALGATAYSLLTGSPPPVSVSRMLGECELLPASRINPDVSKKLDSVLYRMLEVRKEDHYPSIREVREALHSALSSRTPGLRQAFRVCALCRHLQIEAQEETFSIFSCERLKWKTREDQVASTVRERLTLTHPGSDTCPYWEAHAS